MIRSKSQGMLVFVAAGMMMLAAAGAANADIVFTKITNNNVEDISAQLRVQVVDEGAGKAGFRFFNDVGIASVLAQIYFMDGTTLMGISGITSSAGVAFSNPATPGALPGEGLASPPFVTTPGFSAGADNPAPKNGVNALGEWVQITFNLKNAGWNYLTAQQALEAGSLRVGLHVTGIGVGRSSDSYVTGGTAVPAPGAALLSCLGLGVVGWLKRRVA